ncbi:hypothetical protein TNCV_1422761 [Trichonephila clavipes]|nr:hypothetical protein TNCV_1422761 [Trichonephila clavipes]
MFKLSKLLEELKTSLDELLTAMGALIEPLPCRYEHRRLQHCCFIKNSGCDSCETNFAVVMQKNEVKRELTATRFVTSYCTADIYPISGFGVTILKILNRVGCDT